MSDVTNDAKFAASFIFEPGTYDEEFNALDMIMQTEESTSA